MNKTIRILSALSVIVMSAFVSSCDVYDDAGDCSVHYKVPFTYTQHFNSDPGIDEQVDAFPSERITKVTLYVYDINGNLVLRKTETGEALRKSGYAMDVDLHPGRYEMLAWFEGTPAFTPATAFEIGSDDSSIEGLSATLPLDDNGGELSCSRDIVPLYHGYSSSVELPDTYGDVLLPAIDLMKDTNILNVSLENVDGTEISPDAIKVYIETDNSEMNRDNTLRGNRGFRHYPWYVTSFSSIREDEPDMIAGENDDTRPIKGLLSEFTTGRLMRDRKPVLVIHRVSDGHDERFDLVQLLCMVRGHYKGVLTDQQYLDRMDYHELIFFMDANLNWYSAAGISINGWKVVDSQDVYF